MHDCRRSHHRRTAESATSRTRSGRPRRRLRRARRSTRAAARRASACSALWAMARASGSPSCASATRCCIHLLQAQIVVSPKVVKAFLQLQLTWTPKLLRGRSNWPCQSLLALETSHIRAEEFRHGVLITHQLLAHSSAQTVSTPVACAGFTHA